ncbi:heterokaryon incompatibility Het-C [Acrodontium crateriforme]|uniref:Heterokaryon incompatibility Het-C n=1 Tax=Acrodontium crateriforme TaxID=150365 RepID=A0AAQ3MCC8_9PEZI|nr:heterokaryon incompatibility Het-C [Acrodontium crateriforme]
MRNFTAFLLVCLIALVLLPSPVAAFGAGNIASISAIEGHNWRHGDIEDLLETVAFIKGHKWTSMMIKRAYFGNWLRDYSQALDVGTLKGVQADTLRVLVWILAFMSFGYATGEFEVTAERLGVYRAEEHIDNPKDYADNVDARQYDKRLRGPVEQIELAIDPDTGMKNYIANESGDWATSIGYIRWCFGRSIHFGRLYTHGANRGQESDLCEALRCLGSGLHTMEDFGAHTNYVELALRELGFHNVFPHVGTQTMINLRGKQVYPLVTGTFGGVDFLHSVLGEANDHMTQTEVNESEVDQVNAALSSAANANKRGMGGDPGSEASGFTSILSQIPGTSGLVDQAVELQRDSDAQAAENERAGGGPYGDSYNSYGGQYGGASRDGNQTFDAPPGSQGGPPGPGIPGLNMNVDPAATIKKIYPILLFRDNVVRTISGIVSKIPGLEKMIDTITEKVTLFVMGLLAPYVKPIIAAASNALKQGSGTVVSASQKQQYVVWNDPTSSDPTHSLLSKDHFSNILNEPAGQVAAAILQYAAPRVIYGWEHPEVPVEEIITDISRAFHHPAIRDQNCEIHRNMMNIVEKWVHSRSDRGSGLNNILSSESVKAGKNHQVQNLQNSVQGLEGALSNLTGLGGGTSSHSTTAGGPLAMFAQKRELGINESTYPSAQPQSSYGTYSGEGAYGTQAYGAHGHGQVYQQPGYQQGDYQQQGGGYSGYPGQQNQQYGGQGGGSGYY